MIRLDNIIEQSRQCASRPTQRTRHFNLRRPATMRTIVARIRAGETIGVISRDLGVSSGAIWSVLAAHGLTITKIREQQPTTTARQRIRERR